MAPLAWRSRSRYRRRVMTRTFIFRRSIDFYEKDIKHTLSVISCDIKYPDVGSMFNNEEFAKRVNVKGNVRVSAC